MTLSELRKAIDAGLNLLQLPKCCAVSEDDNAYYILGCTNDGERMHGCGTSRVDKRTYKATYDLRGTPPKPDPNRRKVEIPTELNDVFLELDIY